MYKQRTKKEKPVLSWSCSTQQNGGSDKRKKKYLKKNAGLLPVAPQIYYLCIL